MKLTELSGYTEKSLLDVTVQIIEIYKQNENDNSFVMRPENFTAERNNEYFEISYKKELSFDENFFPVPKSEQFTEKNAVFCLGMIIYRIVSGNSPDPKKASELMDFIENKDDSFKFLTYEKVYGESPKEKSLVWDIISRSTELNTELRPSFSDIMHIIISAFPSEAKIKITENSQCLDEVIIKTESAFNVWHSEKSYEYNGKKFAPEKHDFIIPYRLFTKEYIFGVHPDNSPEPEKIPLEKNSEKYCMGIDFGMWKSSVSFINADGYSEDFFPDGGDIPTALCYFSEDKIFFGKDTVKHNPVSVMRNFKRNAVIGNMLNITAENGDIINKTYYDLCVEYLKFIYGEIQKKFAVTNENSEIVLAVPACYDSGMKTVILNAAKKAGFQPDIITEPEAAAFFLAARENICGNTLIIDIGAGTSDICLVNFSKDGNLTRISTENTDGICSLGGADFTEKLFGQIIKMPAVKNSVNMESLKESGLSEKHFLENIAIIKNTAENLKTMLSYEVKASADTELYIPNKSEKEKINISVKRKPFEILIKEEIFRLKKCILKSVENRNTENVIVTGGASLTPAVRNMIVSVFSETETKIHYADYPTAVSRGAAVCANLLAEKIIEKQGIPELTYDIGILTVGAYGERPVFQCLARAGTSLKSGGITLTAMCSPTDDEKKNNYCRLFLYRRPKEFSYVESTFDPDGDAICPAGSLYVSDFPENFSLSEGKIKFSINIDSQECISADVSFCMPDKNSGNFTATDGGNAVFMPYSAK